MRAHQGSGKLYEGEVGRRTVLSASLSKVMVPMDLIFHMLHFPSPKRIPEYRMTIRFDCSLARARARVCLLIVPAYRLLRTLTTAVGQPTQCLYLYIPSIPMHTLVRQVSEDMVQLKGAFDKGTISDRMHLSAFISGGKRRVSRADNGLACVMRTAKHLIERSARHGTNRRICRSKDCVTEFVPWRETL